MDFQKISLDSVFPSPMNPRKTFDEEAVKELAANIEKQGLIQPITVRPSEHEDFIDDETGEVISVPTTYEIVCGERRYRAFRLLKEKEDELNIKRADGHRKKHDRFQSIPAMIREMTDEEAFEAMITENLQRQDVDPMEEAFAFAQLIKSGKTAEDVALKFGKSTRFIQDRCKLNALIPELVVSVKEDKMSIAAAMIICKLDEESQRKYFSQYRNNYQGLSKATAEGFVNNLFMTISRAPWYKSDDQADEEFEGGCDCACSKCQSNTANHGCLFWEMRAQGDGRCTDRLKFQSKVLAYMVRVLDKNADLLVKAGEPLERGKTVVGLTLEEYGSESTKSVKAAFKAEVEARGYEIVNPATAFESRCWYDADDERTIEKHSAGEVYRVLSVTGYDMPELSETFFYVRKDDESVNSEYGRPMNVNNLLKNYRILNDSLPASLVVGGCKALGEHGAVKDLKGLDNSEFVIAYSLMVKNNRELCTELGLGDFPKSEDIRKYVASHMDKVPYIIRSWVKKALSTGTAIIPLDEVRNIAEPYIDRIGELWCPTEYAKAREKVREKHEKAVRKIAGQLEKLGYDLDGNKLPENDEPQDEEDLPDQLKQQ